MPFVKGKAPLNTGRTRWKKGCTPWNKGLFREKNSLFGRKRSDKIKKKISRSRKNNPKAILASKSNAKKMGEMNRGREQSKETKEKKSKAWIGENNPMWRGGISFYPYPQDWTETLKESIRIRDGYVCQVCGIHQDESDGRFKRLDVHHIDYNKENCNPDNLVALCRSCHTKTNHNRDYWINYFKKLKL